MADEQNSGFDGGAWIASRVGNAIDAFVDRESVRPFELANGGAYGIAPDGSVYPLGQQTYQGQTQIAVKSDNTMLILIAVAAYFLLKG